MGGYPRPDGSAFPPTWEWNEKQKRYELKGSAGSRRAL